MAESTRMAGHAAMTPLVKHRLRDAFLSAKRFSKLPPASTLWPNRAIFLPLLIYLINWCYGFRPNATGQLRQDNLGSTAK